MHLPLQAASASGEMTTFDIEDCPKLVDDEYFYLANRPGTALLRKDTIFRGSDVFSPDGTRVFEGDILRSAEGMFYIVQFYNGFKARSQDGKFHSLSAVNQFTCLGNYLQLCKTNGKLQWICGCFRIPKYSRIRYMGLSQNTTFSLFDIIGVSEENVLVYRDGGKIVGLYDIGQFSGIKHPSGKGYYYGQFISGVGTVTIRLGNPGITTIDGFKGFVDKELRKTLEFK